jgi:excisionase family DNA binding protein
MKFIAPVHASAKKPAKSSTPGQKAPICSTPDGLAPESDADGQYSRFTDLSGIARKLGVSRRYVQTLVRRKAIPVIRLGYRCVRFDLEAVLRAVKRFEVEEIRS